jgi:hypothetical protein
MERPAGLTTCESLVCFFGTTPRVVLIERDDRVEQAIVPLNLGQVGIYSLRGRGLAMLDQSRDLGGGMNVRSLNLSSSHLSHMNSD